MYELSERLQESVFPAKVVSLNNGLTVIHQYLPTATVAVADVWVRAGATNEPQEWSGMAHFLEHMIFKGSKRIQPGVYDRIIENLGGMTNAATSHDYAHFFLTTAADYLEKTLPYLGEILLQAEISDEEFYRERDVVLEEIRYSYDDPDWVGFQALCETIYQYHPYKRPILGDEGLLLNHTPNQMRCFHGTHYQPENMTVCIIGGIKEDKALDLVDKSFADFNIPSECPANILEAEPPLTHVRRSEIYLPRIEQARLSLGWIGPGVEHLDDAFGLDLISVILASSRNSRLVRELREEKHLVLDICSNFSLQKDSSLFTINAWLEPKHLESVEEIIQEKIKQLQNYPITMAELIRCQRLLCHDYTFSTETPGQLAGLYGYYQTIAQAQLSVTYPAMIKKLTTLEIQRIANQYLASERYAVNIIRPC